MSYLSIVQVFCDVHNLLYFWAFLLFLSASQKNAEFFLKSAKNETNTKKEESSHNYSWNNPSLTCYFLSQPPNICIEIHSLMNFTDAYEATAWM